MKKILMRKLHDFFTAKILSQFFSGAIEKILIGALLQKATEEVTGVAFENMKGGCIFRRCQK